MIAATASTAGIVLDLFTTAPRVLLCGRYFRSTANNSQTCSASNGANGMLRTTNQTTTSDSATAADQRWCCQQRIRRPTTRPYVHATYAHTSRPSATRPIALNLAAANTLPCIRLYSIRKLPQPGQSIPNSALVGHT